MSKIIEALEKAKREGTLDRLVETIDERRTVEPARDAERNAVGPRPATCAPKPKGVAFPSIAMPAVGELEGVDSHLEPLLRPMSVVSEQYRALRSRIERQDFGRRVQVIAVTSSIKGEGKSLSSANLALVLSQDATKRVLLVDADLRRPTIHTLLGLPRATGLADILQQEQTGVIQQTSFFGLSVVTSGGVSDQPSELLAGPELRHFLQDCRREFDYIILDTPPLIPISDVSFLADSVDGIVFVVKAGKTSKAVVRQAAESLPDGKILGSILNQASAPQGPYGYAKYGGSGPGYY